MGVCQWHGFRSVGLSLLVAVPVAKPKSLKIPIIMTKAGIERATVDSGLLSLQDIDMPII